MLNSYNNNECSNKFSHYHFSSKNQNNNDNLTVIDINSKSIDSLKHVSLQSQAIPEDYEGLIVSNSRQDLNTKIDDNHCLCLVPQLIGNLYNNLIQEYNNNKDKILDHFKKKKK